ncbi:MAG TPA: hypothetical protein VM409_08175, partial [Chloroflexia bacterium]|nr:hypothetical protein [Chloroflexia bacterium]
PLFTERGRGENHYQMYQILHHKPRFGGRWARDHKLTNPNNFVKRASLFRNFWLLDLPEQLDLYYPEHDFLRRTDYRAQGLRILQFYKVRYIVVYEEALDPRWDQPAFEGLINQVLGPGTVPFYKDSIMQVYRVPESSQTTQTQVPLPQLLTLDVGNGWYGIQSTSDGTVYRWADNTLGQASELVTMNLSNQPVRAVLKGNIYAYKQDRTVNMEINGYRAATYELKPGDDPKKVEVELTLPPGNNLITFSTPQPPLATENPALDLRLLSFGMFGVDLLPK